MDPEKPKTDHLSSPLEDTIEEEDESHEELEISPNTDPNFDEESETSPLPYESSIQSTIYPNSTFVEGFELINKPKENEEEEKMNSEPEEEEKVFEYLEDEDEDLSSIVIESMSLEQFKNIENELDEDWLVCLREMKKQSIHQHDKPVKSTDTPESKKNEEEEEEEEEEEKVIERGTEEMKIPEEIIRGLSVIFKKTRDPILIENGENFRVCCVGKSGSGKSSLLNFIMSGYRNMEYILPTGTKTKCVCSHLCHNDPKDFDQRFELVKDKLKESNHREDREEMMIMSHHNRSWKHVSLIDTPGLDEYNFRTSFPNENVDRESNIRMVIERNIRTSHLVLFVVDPRDLDSKDVSEFLTRVTALNKNVVVVMSKFDLVVRQLCIEKNRERMKNTENTENEIKKSMISIEEEVLGIFHRLQEKFVQFGAPVCCIQVKEPIKETGPHYFDVQYLVFILREFQNTKPDTLLSLRNQIYNVFMNRRQIPVTKCNEAMERSKKKRRKNVAVGSAAGTIAAGAIGGIAGLGFIGLGTIILAIPGVGPTLGSGSIISGVAILGGGVLVAGGFMGGMAAFSGIGAYLPPGGRISMSFFHEKVGNVIGNVEVERKVWKKIVKYEKVSVVGKKMNPSDVKKKYFEGKEEDYFDGVIVKLKDRYYSVIGRFKNEKLVTIINLYELVKKK